MDTGLGKMLRVMDGTYMSNAQQIYESLVKQIESKKEMTWRERKDKEFGL